MATITTATYLDDGTTRTAGETFAINGGGLTIRTDTRVHANAPTLMKGSIGSLTTSSTLGGDVLFEGRNVRWMPYDTGTGTVPAIGTTITQGGVSGYLLGVWASTTAAPTAVGAAMPTSGFLKFREVTSGPFASGALTGIGANATSADVVGWIEIVQKQASANTIPRLGTFRARGDWFEIGTTSGSANQTLQVPTNGGGSDTHVPGVWIETSPGSGVYESYPGLSSTYFLAANLGTDVRSKFVYSAGNGQVIIGHDGTTTAGYVPSAGCRVRVPNIFLRQAASGSDAVNAFPHATLGTRPDFTTTSAGYPDFENILSDWYHYYNSAYNARLVNCAIFDTISFSNIASACSIDNTIVGTYNATTYALYLNACTAGGTVTNSKFFRGYVSSNGHAFYCATSTGFTITNCSFGIISINRTTGQTSLNQSRNIVLSNCSLVGSTLVMTTCSNITVNDLDYTDRFVGTTDLVSTQKDLLSITASCDNVTVDGITFGLNGTISGVNCAGSVFYFANSSNLTFRNAGTYSSRLSTSSGSEPLYLVRDGGANDTVKAQRVFCDNRTLAVVSVNTTSNYMIQSVFGSSGAQYLRGVNMDIKGLGVPSLSNSLQTSVYGTNYAYYFTSATTGVIRLYFNEPTSANSAFYEAVVLGTGAGFTSGNQISMPNLGDQVIFEMPYYALGMTALTNTDPNLIGVGTSNFDLEYKIDLNDGNGYSASWASMTGANLSAHSLTSNGFTLRVRITCNNAASTNACSFLDIFCDSTAVAQESNTYPLDYSPITLTGLIVGSRVQLYDVTNAVELYNGVVTDTSLTKLVPYVSDFSCMVRVMYMSGVTAKMFEEFTQTCGVDGFSRVISQTDDVIYNANAIDGSAITTVTIDDGTLTVEVDTGSISWQQLYAYETYWLFTEEGIRDESRFIEAVDAVNYLFTDFKIKNVSSPSSPLAITGGYGRDASTLAAIDLVDNTGGTIFCAPDHVIGYSSVADSADLADIKAKTKLIPAAL